jgi:hypothetical protein
MMHGYRTLAAAKVARAHAEAFVAALREDAPTARDSMSMARTETQRFAPPAAAT